MTKQELLTFIAEMFGISKCNEMILRQINKYVTEHGYKYLDIARALSFYVDVQGSTLELKYGIGIVPYVMEEAQAYYRELLEQREHQLQAATATITGEHPIIQVRTQQSSTKTIKRPKIDISQF